LLRLQIKTLGTEKNIKYLFEVSYIMYSTSSVCKIIKKVYNFETKSFFVLIVYEYYRLYTEIMIWKALTIDADYQNINKLWTVHTHTQNAIFIKLLGKKTKHIIF